MRFEGLNELLCADESAEKKLEVLAYQYNERLKEQALVNGISQILFDRNLEREYILKKVIELIPPGWQYPEITVARFKYKDYDVKSPNFRETPWKQRVTFCDANGAEGFLDVLYLKEKPEDYEGPFLKEERNLINVIGSLLPASMNIFNRKEETSRTIDDILYISGEIERGNIRNRISLSHQSGDLEKVARGINGILDSYSVPFEQLLKTLDDYSMCHFNSRIIETKGFHGEFLVLKNSINSVGEKIGDVVFEIGRMADEFEKGNFGARVDEKLVFDGDIAAIKKSLNNVAEIFSAIVSEVSESVERINQNSAGVGRSADDMAEAAEKVARSASESAVLTERLNKGIDSIDRQISDLSSSNQEIASASNVVMQKTGNVVEIGKVAKASGDDSRNLMNSVEVIAKNSVDEINSLSEQINTVGKVVGLINDITGQINLLALNAAIEAARAGEHGRGFAVVAGEVKNLANEARTATSSIEKVVTDVRVSSENTASAINKANTEIIRSVESVNKTIDGLNKISGDAETIYEDVGRIVRAIEDQVSIANKVSQNTSELTGLTGDVFREIEELAALAEETSASVEEIGASVNEVSSLTDILSKDMKKYRV
ncbi:MAG: methyl-accepting chemotaxis protein [Methanomicrobiaceae archaeon]|nr:methyl-accepting chemotaxis protein [Methanomicrobiaceae archaeon]